MLMYQQRKNLLTVNTYTFIIKFILEYCISKPYFSQFIDIFNIFILFILENIHNYGCFFFRFYAST